MHAYASSAPTAELDPDLARFGYRPQLRRTLRWPDMMYFGLIYMVPIAPFAIFGSVFAASAGMVALAYAVGMAAMLLVAISYGQMVRAFPVAGSVYTYAGRGIAAAVGFLTGWAAMLDYLLVPCLLSLVAAANMNGIVPSVPVWVWLVGFVAANTIFNLFGMRITAWLTKLFLGAQLIVLGVFFAFAIQALTDGRGRGFTLEPLYNPTTFTPAVIFAAVSVAMLSFLGFDGISMLAEEGRGSTDGRRRGSAWQVSRAMKVALVGAGVLFIVQSLLASLLVPDPQGLIANGDPNGTAFKDAAAVAGGPQLAALTAVATALAWGLANNMVAQVATSRLLYSMARDRQLPKFFKTVTTKRAVPANATLVVAAVSLGLGLGANQLDNGIELLATVVNMGALTTFFVLHLSVVVHYVFRNASRRFVTHLLIPVAGMVLLGAVAYNAEPLAQQVVGAWLALGALILGIMLLAKRPPRLAGFDWGRP